MNLANLGSGLENFESFYNLNYFSSKVGLMNQTPTEEESKSYRRKTKRMHKKN